MKVNISEFLPLKEKTRSVLLELENHNVEDLAIDYVHDLLYWTDSKKKAIEVASVTNVSKRMVLVDSGLDEPYAIVVNVLESFLV